MTHRSAAVLLAAGLSTRMGRPKPLLPWDGRTLVEFQVAQLQEGGVEHIIVVTGHEAGAVAAVLDGSGAHVVFNAAYREGRAGSVRAGALAAPADHAIVVLNVDQPRPAAITRELLAAHAAGGASITVPVFAGRRGHPVVFAAALLPELQEVDEATQGLRAVRDAHAADLHEHPVTDPRVLLDVNTPEAYLEALRAFGLDHGG